MKELIFYLYSAAIVLAFACIGFTRTIPQQGHSEAGLSMAFFDPLILPLASFDREPWLDPMVFMSDKAYVVSARISPNAAPRSNARFIGGQDRMVSYLKTNITGHIAKGIGWLKPPTVSFIVNELGETEKIVLVSTSGNAELDKRLVAVIEEMPVWIPAENTNGKAVKQEFEFNVVQGACDQNPPVTPVRSVSMYDSPLIDPLIAKEHPYDLEFALEKIDGTHYTLITSMKLFGGSFYVSPHSTQDFKGKFSVELADHKNVVIGLKFNEIPWSIEEIDQHQFVNGPVNWVKVDTKYEHTLTITSKEDFDVGGKYRFTIEPKCTMEEIPFIIKFRSGVLSIEKRGC